MLTNSDVNNTINPINVYHYSPLFKLKKPADAGFLDFLIKFLLSHHNIKSLQQLFGRQIAWH
jgi:ArsR family metal-binding transcriptional regulator